MKLNMKHITFLIFTTVLLIGVGCSKRIDIENAKKLTSQNLNQQLVIYPHGKSWKKEHLTSLININEKSSLMELEGKCLVCHQNSLGPKIELNCTMKCHKGETDSLNTIPSKILNGKNANSKCMSCHEAVYKNKYSHYPVFADLCSTCHTVSEKHLLGQKDDANRVITKDSQSDCYRCHVKKDQAPFVHDALKYDSNCSDCHNPHGGKVRYFIKENSIKDLCQSCHSKIPSEEGADLIGKSCLNCHDPHSSKYKRLLLAPSKETTCPGNKINP